MLELLPALPFPVRFLTRAGSSPANPPPPPVQKTMLPHELCSRISNASMARHRWVPLAPTTQHMSLLSLLLSHGFISSVSYGSTNTSAASPPDPTSYAAARASDKRVWAELKYRHDRPVLNKMRLVSSPSRRIFMDKDEIRRFVRGSRVKFVPGLGLGEVALVKSNEGWVDGREAVRRGLGGEVIARVG